MKLIVGLGNPGLKYKNTRHNIGFDYFSYITKKYNLEFKLGKFNAEEATIKLKNEKIIFVKPLLFMNLSGEVVKKYYDYYNLNSEDILVIQDDLAMKLGKIRIHYNRNNGGHNGIKNIEELLKTKKFFRVKIGVDSELNKIENFKKYVLSVFSDEEIKTINMTYEKLFDLVDDFVFLSNEDFQRKYNSEVKINE